MKSDCTPPRTKTGHYLYRGWIFPFLIKVHPGSANFSVVPAVFSCECRFPFRTATSNLQAFFLCNFLVVAGSRFADLPCSAQAGYLSINMVQYALTCLSCCDVRVGGRMFVLVVGCWLVFGCCWMFVFGGRQVVECGMLAGVARSNLLHVLTTRVGRRRASACAFKKLSDAVPA